MDKRNITVSERAQNTPASAVRVLEPIAQKAKKRGISIYHLNIGQPDLPTPQKMLTVIKKMDISTLKYAPSSGMSETIDAWRTFFVRKGMTFAQDELIVTSGGSEGLLFSMLAIADPGDNILVFEPFYTSYAVVAAMGNIKLNAVLTDGKDGFHLPDKEVIEKHITTKTKAILICNPNNPTGTMYTQKETEMLIEIAKKKNLFILSDETYQELVYGDNLVTRFFDYTSIHERLIIIDSVSKRFNACGARIGCVASKNQEVMQAVLRFAQGRLSVATVEQEAVIPMLINPGTYIEKIRKEYKKRRDVVCQKLKEIEGSSFVVPDGAFYIIPTLPIQDSDRFARYLLEDFQVKKETVMVAPATGFYATHGKGKNQVRLAYVLEEKYLKKALDLLKEAIIRYQKIEKGNV